MASTPGLRATSTDCWRWGGGDWGVQGWKRERAKKGRNNVTSVHRFPRSPYFVSRSQSVLRFTLTVGDLGTRLSSLIPNLHTKERSCEFWMCLNSVVSITPPGASNFYVLVSRRLFLLTSLFLQRFWREFRIYRLEKGIFDLLNWWCFVLLNHNLILRMRSKTERASSFAGKTALKFIQKINPFGP